MKRFTSRSQKIGEIAEIIVNSYFKKKRYTIFERNYTKKYGEIDLIAAKKNILHFVEVKCVSCEIGSLNVIHETKTGIRPEDNMHPQKIRRLHNTLQAYLAENPRYGDMPFQLDLACVYIDENNKKVRISIIENIIT